jgi:hypothetical protein
LRRRLDRELYRGDADFADVVCAHCQSSEVTVQSLFGSAASEVLLYCESCRSAFTWVKWRGRLPAGPRATGVGEAAD